jgi:hypothetical protein
MEACNFSFKLTKKCRKKMGILKDNGTVLSRVSELGEVTEVLRKISIYE